jgi:hypothetical protein
MSDHSAVTELSLTDEAVATPAGEDGRVEPWFLRWPPESGLTPVWVGVGLAALLVALAGWGALEVAEPIIHQRAAFERRVPFLMTFSIVLVFASARYFIRATERDFDALLPRLRGTPSEIADIRRALTHCGRGGLWLGAVVGIATMVAIQELNTQRFSRFMSGDWNVFDVWAAAVITWCGAGVYQVLVVAFSTAGAMNRMGSTLLDLRLFDPDLGRPIARFGLRTMLLYAASPSLLLGAWQILSPGVSTTLIYMWIVCLIVGCACLVLPSKGLRSRIRACKRAELRRIDKAVHGETSALSDSPMREQIQHLGLVDLLAYRREVAAVREWPSTRRS